MYPSEPAAFGDMPVGAQVLVIACFSVAAVILVIVVCGEVFFRGEHNDRVDD